MRPWILAETNLEQVRQQPYEVVVLPLGATEPHNLHLPYGTDTFEGEILGEKVCGEAYRRGARVVMLPTIPYGTETNQREFPLSMNVNPSTMNRLLTDLIDSLAGHGIRKIVLLNCHGGNDFKPLLRELYGRTPAHLFLCNFYQVLADVNDEIFDDAGDHAGEMETAFALAYFPEFVSRREDGSLAADDGGVRPTRFEAVNRGWVSITRPWHLLTRNAGSGNPHPATEEKGKRMMDLLVDRLATFLTQLAASPVDEHFPFVAD